MQAFYICCKFNFMRGEKIYQQLVKDNGTKGTVSKGRSDKLVSKRNDCLLARYYYYGHFKNFCYEEILRQLVAEFFLSPKTIISIVQNNTDNLLSFKEQGLVMFYFQRNWPHLKW